MPMVEWRKETKNSEDAATSPEFVSQFVIDFSLNQFFITNLTLKKNKKYLYQAVIA